MLGLILAGALGLTVAQAVPHPQGPQSPAPALFNDTTVNAGLPSDSSVEIVRTDSAEAASHIANLFEPTGSAAVTAPRLNPRAVAFVEDYVEKNSRNLQEIKSRALPYFNMMDGIMLQYGLPRELKYLAVIESQMKAGARSYAGAVGPWQLMRETAVNLGLKVNKKVDERRNYVKSTQAAAKYLKSLYGIYGDWLLVIASYNAGPGTVQRAIAKSGSRNFWDLQYYLPAETRLHVKKFIGTHYVFEGQGGLTTLTKSETSAHFGQNLYAFNRQLSNDEHDDAKTQQVAGKYQGAVIARHIGMSLEDFNRYNPDFDKIMAGAAKGYEMKLPEEKMQLFNANKYQILRESVESILASAAASNS